MRVGVDASMQLAHVFASILAVQVQAAALGAPVEESLQRAERALYVEIERVPVLMLGEELDVPEERPESAFDPEPHDAMMMASRCRALLLEVVKRAAHDWVLYRNTRKRQELVMAEDAYLWLFEEKPGHPRWELRQREGEPLMAFLTICELMDLEPDAVRRRVKELTRRDIERAGRPAENRKVKHVGVEDYEAPEGLDEASVSDATGLSSYEKQFAVHTY